MLYGCGERGYGGYDYAGQQREIPDRGWLRHRPRPEQSRARVFRRHQLVPSRRRIERRRGRLLRHRRPDRCLYLIRRCKQLHHGPHLRRRPHRRGAIQHLRRRRRGRDNGEQHKCDRQQHGHGLSGSPFPDRRRRQHSIRPGSA